jgi:hypothetical protein
MLSSWSGVNNGVENLRKNIVQKNEILTINETS